jgi:hypothetical protein
MNQVSEAIGVLSRSRIPRLTADGQVVATWRC